MKIVFCVESFHYTRGYQESYVIKNYCIFRIRIEILTILILSNTPETLINVINFCRSIEREHRFLCCCTVSEWSFIDSGCHIDCKCEISKLPKKDGIQEENNYYILIDHFHNSFNTVFSIYFQNLQKFCKML